MTFASKKDIRAVIVAVLQRGTANSWVHPQVPKFSTVCKTFEVMEHNKIAVRKLAADEYQAGGVAGQKLSANDMAEWLLASINGAFWTQAGETDQK